MRALKILVTVMGILLVVGTVGLVAAIIHRQPNRVATQPAVNAAPGRATLFLPAGARIDGMTAIGARLELRVTDAMGRQSLLLVDPANGAIDETIEVQAREPETK